MDLRRLISVVKNVERKLVELSQEFDMPYFKVKLGFDITVPIYSRSLEQLMDRIEREVGYPIRWDYVDRTAKEAFLSGETIIEVGSRVECLPEDEIDLKFVERELSKLTADFDITWIETCNDSLMFL